jgi:choline kinase/predicted kinase
MRAILIAAGMGSRLKHYTDDKPKGLVEVAGKPILGYVLDNLKAAGITDLVVVIGYKKEMIRDFVKNNFHGTLNFVESHEYETTNTAYSWWLARDYIKNESKILHLHSDLIYSPRVLKKIIANPHSNCLCIDTRVSLNTSMEQVKLDEKGKMVFMDKAMVPGANGKAVGVAKFSNDAITYMLAKIDEAIEAGDKKIALYSTVRKAVLDLDFYGVDIGYHFFNEINTIEEYNVARARLSEFPIQKVVIMLNGYPTTGKTMSSRKIRNFFEGKLNVQLISTIMIRKNMGFFDLHSENQRNVVYEKIAEQLENELVKDMSDVIIVDGNFNKSSRRDMVYNVVKKHGATCFVVQCELDTLEEVQKRLDERKMYSHVFEHKALSMDLYNLIKDTSEPIENDFASNPNLVLIKNNTESNKVFAETSNSFAFRVVEALRN